MPIGDWSNDGHGQCEWFLFRSNKPVEEWQEAYFKAREKWPHLAPDADDDGLARVAWEEWPHEEIQKVLGFSKKEFEDDEEKAHALYTATFCQKVDPSLKFEIINHPSFVFSGYDEKGRHIGQIGYEIWMYD